MKSGKNEQIESFRKTARALGCHEDKEKFEAQLGRIAAHKPQEPMSRKIVKKRRSNNKK